MVFEENLGNLLWILRVLFMKIGILHRINGLRGEFRGIIEDFKV